MAATVCSLAANSCCRACETEIVRNWSLEPYPERLKVGLTPLLSNYWQINQSRKNCDKLPTDHGEKLFIVQNPVTNMKTPQLCYNSRQIFAAWHLVSCWKFALTSKLKNTCFTCLSRPAHKGFEQQDSVAFGNALVIYTSTGLMSQVLADMDQILWKFDPSTKIQHIIAVFCKFLRSKPLILNSMEPVRQTNKLRVQLSRQRTHQNLSLLHVGCSRACMSTCTCLYVGWGVRRHELGKQFNLIKIIS